MKKLIVTALAAAMLLTAAAAESGHEHVWGVWQAGEGGHTAQCVSCDATKTAKHYTASVTLADGTARASVCLMCGACGEQAFELIPEATCVPTSANPAAQKGNLVVRGLEKPFPADGNVLYGITLCYERNGELATFKNVSTVSVPVNGELPEGWRLVRVQSAAGDDSVQNPETWIDIKAELLDGSLSFQTRTPGLYLILAQ